MDANYTVIVPYLRVIECKCDEVNRSISIFTLKFEALLSIIYK